MSWGPVQGKLKGGEKLSERVRALLLRLPSDSTAPFKYSLFASIAPYITHLRLTSGATQLPEALPFVQSSGVLTFPSAMATSLPRRFALSALRPASRSLLSPSSATSSRALSSLPRLLPRAQNNGAVKTLCSNPARLAAIQHARTFTSSRKLFEGAPSSKAYLASGAIAGGGDLVDVSKVLVIGSGGLSIGQAGEFDYSGIVLSPLCRCSIADVRQARRL
jgi:hypothetical protein